MSTPIGVTLTADDQQLLAILNRVDGKLDAFSASATQSFQRTGAAAGAAGAQMRTMDKQTGMSVGAMRAAMATVPLQMQDIVVSLQAGQAPLTVLLQQGSQLAGSFGGVLPALKAVGSYLVSLINPFTVVAGAVALLGGAFLSGRSEMERTARQMILAGNTAGVTAEQMQSLAASIDGLSGATQGRAVEVLNQMAAAGVKGATSLKSFTITALELERVGGPAVEDTVKAFQALGRDPVQASLELNKSTNFLTESLFRQIKALQDQGRTVEAAALAQRSYDDAMKARLPALEQQLGLVSRAWSAVAKAAKEAWDAIKSVGRTEGLDEQLAQLERRLALTDAPWRQQALRQEIESLQEQIRLRNRSTSAQDDQNRRTQAAIKFAADEGNFLDRKARLERDIARIRADGMAAGAATDARVMAEMERRIAFVREQAETKPKKERLSDEARLLQQMRQMAEAGAQRVTQQQAELDMGRSLTQAEEDYLRVMSEVAAGRLRMVDVQRTGLQAQLQDNLARAQATDVARQEAAWMEHAARANEAAAAARAQQTASLRTQVAAERQSVAAIGLSARELAAREAALLRDAAAAKDRAAVEADLVDWTGKASAEYREQARLLRERATLAEQGVVAREAQEAAEAWKRTTESIGQGITDALMRGFESGRGFMDSFVSTLKSAFKTLVLQPTIKAIVAPMAASLTGMLGLTGAAQAGQGGGLLSGLSGLGNLGGLLSAGVSGLGNSLAFGADALGSFLVNNTGGMLNSLGGSLMSNAGAIGTLGPYAAAAAAAMALFRTLRHRRTPHSGSVVGIDATGDASTLFGDDSRITNNFQAETDAALRGLGGASIASLNALSQAFGGTSSFGGTLKFAADGNDPSIGQFIVGRNGNIVSQVGSGATSLTGGGQFAFYDKDRELAFTAFTADVARATRQALQTIDLPQWARDQIAALGNDATIEQIATLVESISTMQRALRGAQDSFAQVGGVFGRLSTLGGDAFMQLAQMAGGIDNLRAQAQGFIENYFERDEIAGIKARDIQQALAAVGIERDISTREEFRALVEGVDVSSEQGRQQLATLLAAQASFLEVAQYIQEVGGSLSSVAGTAPDMGAIGGLLTAPEQAQIDAINGVTVAVESVRDAILDLGSSMTTGRSTLIDGRLSSDQWETTVQP